MELIRISDRKLKIMLTPTDMCHFELDPNGFSDDGAQMHRAFRHLMGEIRRCTDFDPDEGSLSVQFFPSREGGCEMFVCNLDDGESTPGRAALPSPAPRTGVRQYRRGHADFHRECAYRFSALPHLLSVCRRLFGVGCVLESSAFRDERGEYLLFLTVCTSSPFATPEEIEFVVEYGTIENAAALRLYILEHAAQICESDAVGTLARLA